MSPRRRQSTAEWSRRAGLRWVRLFVAAISLLSPASALAQTIVPGFNANALPENDDGSTAAVGLGFTINFFGVSASSVFVNNNGNVTLVEPLSTYTPFDLNSTSQRIIAPFFADIDTRTDGGTVTYGTGTLDGRPAFGVNWLNVDYFNSDTVSHPNRNSFQLILIERSDTGAGNFDFWFNYGQIQWETGQFSGGDANGLGGFSARVGYANGQGVSYEQAGSAVNGAFLDSNLATGLIRNRVNSTLNGRYIFQVRNGSVTPTTTITTITPRRGTTAGGTPLVILGANFLAGTTVTVGGQPASNVVLTGSTQISCIVPPGSVGVAPLVVSNSGGSASSTFEYVLPAARSFAGSRRPSMSYDGRYTAFESRVALVADDTNGSSDIYVYDTVTDTVRRVSVSSVGSQALGGESTDAAIDATGRFVAFASRAANLVPHDTNALQDVFLHDRDADGNGIFDESGPGAVSTVRVNLTIPPGGAIPVQATGGSSGDPSISGSGRWIAFESTATNLVTDANGFQDVFVHDRLLGVTRRISVATSGAEATGGDSGNPAISLDGRFVAFDSGAIGLVTGDANAARDVFVHDRDIDGDGVMDEAGSIATTRVSVDGNGSEALGGDSVDPSITETGRWVAFASKARNLVLNDTNEESDIFLHDRSTGATRRLSQGPNGAQWIGPSFAPVISANGQRLDFLTSGLNAPSAGGALTAGQPSVWAGVDDGKSTTGTIPLPTNPTPPPPIVEPPSPTTNQQDPAVSGDGSRSSATTQPLPGSGNSDPTVTMQGPTAPPESASTPFIAALVAAQGPTTGTNSVDIQGANFQVGSTVSWNGALRPATRVSSQLLRVTAPAVGAPEIVAVQVTSGGQSSTPRSYAYVTGLSAPVITSFDPVTSLVAGGQTLTITGTGFSSPSVRLGPYPAAVQAATPTSITVVIPAASVGGPVPIVVANSDGAVASNGPFTYVVAAPVLAPTVETVQPASGPATGGTTIAVRGQHFGPGVAVTINGVPASDVQLVSSAELLVVTPPGAEGPATIVVAVPSQPPVFVAFGFQYLAPVSPVLGCTGGDGDGDGVPDPWEEQYGLSAADRADAGLDPDGDGRTNAQECTDGTHPRGLYTRYLAEGATGSFFSTRVAIANPNAAPARVLLRFQTGTNQTVPWFLTVPANARRTIDVQQLPGLESANVSTVIEADAQIVVDRTMRWDQSSRGGAHAESSVSAPALRWYLAEGATHGFFDLFYLVQNPSLTTAANVRIRFLRPSGVPLERLYAVAAGSRFTLPVDTIPELSATDVSAVIESTNNVPIIVERAMYSSAAGVFAAGHDSAGVTALSTEAFFAEGATGRFFDLFLLFANPNATPAQVETTYLLPSGTTVVKAYTIPAESRRTVYVAAEDPRLADTAVSAKIRVTNAGAGMPGIIVERSMWWPSGRAWFEAHNSAGSTVTGTKWAVGDGEEGLPIDGTQTYLLVANTSAFAATLRVTVLLESGAPLPAREYSIAGNSRFNVPVGPEFGLTPGTRFSAVVESLGATPAQIVVERAMYWNAAGVIWAAGSNLLATRLQ